jgi:hypothetical protein
VSASGAFFLATMARQSGGSRADLTYISKFKKGASMKKVVMYFTSLLLGSAILPACTTVKEYQKNRLNDSEMSLSNRKVEKNELNFQTYREGASGANGGKTGGGCGCN